MVKTNGRNFKIYILIDTFTAFLASRVGESFLIINGGQLVCIPSNGKKKISHEKSPLEAEKVVIICGRN